MVKSTDLLNHDLLKAFSYNPPTQIDGTEEAGMNQSQRQDPDHDHDHDQHQDRGQIQDQTSTQSLASSEVHNQSQEQSQSQSSHTFAEVANYSKGFSPNFHMIINLKLDLYFWALKEWQGRDTRSHSYKWWQLLEMW